MHSHFLPIWIAVLLLYQPRPGMGPRCPHQTGHTTKPSIHRPQRRRMPALLRAVQRWDGKAVRRLLIRGADVNCTDGNTTPLIEAIRCGDRRITELLLKRGADVNVLRTEDGFTPLMVAIHGQHETLIPLLLAWRADPNRHGLHQISALQLAKRKMPEWVVDRLKKAGARE